ncbi:hypothetical protein EG329_007756 [Mollisiaceae sp. DMI_Dod_QoI]|nr:hypothetical protein EG329_007756 [Helotiales sp. DMI_Dod_QoI]
MLIYVSGWHQDGSTNLEAGCAFTFGDIQDREASCHEGISFRLENRGPYGEYGPINGHRATLRAVVGALQFRNWSDDEFSELVIATDSKWLTDNSEGDVWKRWQERKLECWEGRDKTFFWEKNEHLPHRDLWQLLAFEVDWHAEHNLKVKLWKTTENGAHMATVKAAKQAASFAEVEHFTAYRGRLPVGDIIN